MSAHDGHTINVGPVTVHADVPAIDRHAHRPWDGTPADLDAERADACRCGPEYYERGLIAPDCSADAIFDLCDEVDRLRGLLARALPWIDPNDSHEDYLLTVEIREALGEGA